MQLAPAAGNTVSTRAVLPNASGDRDRSDRAPGPAATRVMDPPQPREGSVAEYATVPTVAGSVAWVTNDPSSQHKKLANCTVTRPQQEMWRVSC